MKKNLTELVFILDRSGSMGGLERDTIGGFNSMLEKQKREPGDAYVSTVLFDNHREVLHDRLSLQDVPPMTDMAHQLREAGMPLPEGILTVEEMAEEVAKLVCRSK